MDMIRVEHLTRDYGHGRGVFDVSIKVREGEVFGFLGPNGAGKTTTIRHIMGFSRPEEGAITVLGKDAWTQAAAIKREVGYLPGEPEFPADMTGLQFIAYMAGLRGVAGTGRAQELLERFELDPTGRIKRMSMGERRKLAVVCAFLHDPRLLVLDEPTSALDPIMQERFVQFVLEEKAAGKSVLLSSHIFSEVDATCDRIAIIKDGRVVSTVDASSLKHPDERTYKVEFAEKGAAERFADVTHLAIDERRFEQNQLRLRVPANGASALFYELKGHRLNFITEVPFTLEDYFMGFYDRGKSVEEGLEAMAGGIASGAPAGHAFGAGASGGSVANSDALAKPACGSDAPAKHTFGPDASASKEAMAHGLHRD